MDVCRTPADSWISKCALALWAIAACSASIAHADVSSSIADARVAIINQVIGCAHLGKRLTPQEFQEALDLANDSQKTQLQKIQTDQAKLPPLAQDPQAQWQLFQKEVSDLVAQYRFQVDFGDTALDKWQELIDQLKATKSYKLAEGLKKGWNLFLPIHDYMYEPALQELIDMFKKSYFDDFWNWASLVEVQSLFMGNPDPKENLSDYLKCGLEPDAQPSWTEWAEAKFAELPAIPDNMKMNDFEKIFPGHTQLDLDAYVKACPDRDKRLLCMIDRMDQVVIPGLRADFKPTHAPLLSAIDKVAAEIQAQEKAP